MISFIRRYWMVLVILMVPLVMFYPSLFGFFTNDDFFFLKIAHASSFGEFLNFFNPVRDFGGIGVYRPIPLRFIYFLAVEFFHTSPLFLHIVSFITFFLDIFLIGVLIKLLTKSNKIALISSFLYAVSVTHFGILYYINQYQELCMTLFFLVSVIFFVKYELEIKAKRSFNKLILSLIFFVLCIMSKETSVVLPFILLLTHFYLKLTKRINISLKALVFPLLPYFLILTTYLLLHFFYFGVVSGDSYIWNFSPVRALNTLGWYGLWSLNIPEMLVDFVGPGFHLNPNLLKFWSKEITSIFIFFIFQILMIFGSLFILIKKNRGIHKKDWFLFMYSFLWFVATLVPILFLPVHKFSFYLTLPLLGVVLALGYLFEEAKIKNLGVGIFLVVWTVTSIFSLRLTIQTNWITRSQVESYKVYQYFQENAARLVGKSIYFIDTENDSTLPWSPTEILEVILAERNFFDVFYPNLSAKINYVGLEKAPASPATKVIESRQFLGY